MGGVAVRGWSTSAGAERAPRGATGCESRRGHADARSAAVVPPTAPRAVSMAQWIRTMAGKGVRVPTVLVVDDEQEIASLLKSYLERDGHRVIVAGDGEAALRAVEAASPDLVGFDLMLTARDREDDKIRGLELGADDYVTKPFSPREVVARVRAVLRRNRHEGRDVLQLGDFTVDFRGRDARRGGESCHLTPTEWRLLEVLASHPGQGFTRLQLIDRIYGYAFEGFERT